METIIPLAFIAFVLIIAVAVANGMWQKNRGNLLVQQWAERNRFQILECSLRMFRRGPFFFSSSKYQNVYRVIVLAADGSHKAGYVRCGGFWQGMLSDQVEVRWDAEKSAAAQP